MNVLIVDDSWAMRKFVLKQIRASGAPIEGCLEAGDGEQALELLRAQPVDVVFTDIHMPKMNGLELAQALRADAALKGIPVVVISSDAASVRMTDFQPLGAIGYIEKPFTPKELLGEVERLLGLARVVLTSRSGAR